MSECVVAVSKDFLSSFQLVDQWRPFLRVITAHFYSNYGRDKYCGLTDNSAVESISVVSATANRHTHTHTEDRNIICTGYYHAIQIREGYRTFLRAGNRDIWISVIWKVGHCSQQNMMPFQRGAPLQKRNVFLHAVTSFCIYLIFLLFFPIFHFLSTIFSFMADRLQAARTHTHTTHAHTRRYIWTHTDMNGRYTKKESHHRNANEADVGTPSDPIQTKTGS